LALKKMNSQDYFDKKWQMGARTKGKYHEIAASVGKCVFCDLKEKYIVAEDSGLVLTANLFPYADGHLLVIPKRHTENYLNLTQKEIVVAHRLTRKALDLLRKVLDIESVWLLLREGNKTGKTVKHLHWQIIPFDRKMVSWHYQKINLVPENLAKMLRENNG